MQYQPLDSWKHQHATLWHSGESAPQHLFNKAEEICRVTRGKAERKEEMMDWKAKHEQWKNDLYFKRIHLELEISHQAGNMQIPKVNYVEKNVMKYPPLKFRKALFVDGARPSAPPNPNPAAQSNPKINNNLLSKMIPKEDTTTPQKPKQILRPL